MNLETYLPKNQLILPVLKVVKVVKVVVEVVVSRLVVVEVAGVLVS